MNATLVIQLICVVAIALAAYGLGADQTRQSSIAIERRANARLKLAQRQQYELAKWVAEKWPTEYAAYHEGHAEGYQQGISHAPTLMDEADG